MKNSRYKILVVSLLLSGLCFANLSCNAFSDPADSLFEPKISVFFDEPGSRSGNESNMKAEEILIDRINAAKSYIDCVVYGLTNKKILMAIIAAHLRGVKVRVAGDASHFLGNEIGYRMMQQHHIPMQLGNEPHIMHDKLFVIDGLYVFAGTGNITTTGFHRNDNNWVLIEHPDVARRFEVEFEQMYSGKFSTAKKRQSSKLPNTWKIGDTTIEVYFAPEDDTMGRFLEELRKAKNNIYFTIFAFTKDQMGSTMIEKHREFMQKMTPEERARPFFSPDPNVPVRPYVVTGIFDRSQVQGNYLYHEIYRITAAGIPTMIDANENSALPGDYQSGGGRLHSKTMIIDRGTDDARVITGSFNWSSAATIGNDEFLIILHGKNITEQYYNAFTRIWTKSKPTPTAICNYYEGMADIEEKPSYLPVCADKVKEGDVLISEVHWAGWNGMKDNNDHTGYRDDVQDDEFVELYNRTDHPIDLSLWTVSDDYDFKMGFTPGTVIQPHQYFTVLDHNIEQYSDNKQLNVSSVAFQNPNFVLNSANDPRFTRWFLNDESIKLKLIAPTGKVIDVAGDGGLPLAGRITHNNRSINHVYSMERIINKDGSFLPGDDAKSWVTCKYPNKNVTKSFRNKICASPGGPHLLTKPNSN